MEENKIKAVEQPRDRVVLIGLGVFGGLTGVLIVALNPTQIWLLYLLFGLYGFVANSLYPVAVAHANDFARHGEFAKISGGLLLFFGLGLAIGPTLGSILMGAIAPTALFIVTATFHFGIAAFAFWRMRVRTAPDTAGRTPFQVMGGERPSTPEAVALDPRADSDDAFPTTAEAPVPEELMATAEERRDVSNGAI